MKRKIALVSAIIMIVTSLFANGTFAAFSDVSDDNAYKNAILTLSKLSVIDGYEDGTFKPENQITRAEFTKMLITAMGFGNMTTEPEEFDDVVDHWARHYIKTAYDMGIINGTGERTFEPDNPVTYEQAVKMMVCALGYDVTAQSKGGYPGGYMSVGADLGITKNIVNQANSEPALRQVIAQVVYNSLEVETMEYNGVQYEKTDKTLLKDYLGYVKVRGYLVGVGETLTSECDIAINKNQIAVKPYASGDTIAININNFTDYTSGELIKFLGNDMNFYYYQGDIESEKELRIIDTETTQNTQTTINFNDFISYNGSVFKYYSGKDAKTLSMSENMSVIYNGQSLDGSFVTDIAPKVDSTAATMTGLGLDEALQYWLGSDENYNIRGEVVFTDAGNDGTIDMININDYKTMLAYKSLSTSDYILQNKLKSGDNINLDPDAIGKKIYVEKDGKEVAPSSIRANDVVSYTISPDGSVINAYISNETVSGTVSQMNSTDKTITINGKEYNLETGCEDYILEKEGRPLSIGVEGTFYLNKLGYIVYGTLKTVTANPYAYIANITEDFVEDTAYVTLYMPTVSTRDTVTYKLTDKTKINGTTVKSYQDAVTQLQTIAAQTNPDASVSGVYTSGSAQSTEYSQPVRVKVDSSAKTITELNILDETATDKNEDPTKLARYRTLKKYYYTGSSFKESYSGKVEFTVNSSKTTVLYVPQDRSNKTGYSKKTISAAFTSGNYYWVEAYDVNNSNVAQLVILYGDTGKLNEVKKTTDFSVVAGTPNQVYDEAEDMVTESIEVYAGTSTTPKTWTAFKSGEFSDVVAGDVIQFAYDDDNRIQNRHDIFRFADVLSVLNDTSGKTVEYTYGEEGSEYTESRTEIYNWNEEIDQLSDPYYQRYKFDYRYPSSNAETLVNNVINASTEEDRAAKLKNLQENYYEKYTSTTLGVVPVTRACIYNVYQVPEDIARLYLTKEGFDAETGELRASTDLVYDEVGITSSTKILRMEVIQGKMTISPYMPDSETAITTQDLKDASHYGSECSKVMVFSYAGNAKLIVILP